MFALTAIAICLLCIAAVVAARLFGPSIARKARIRSSPYRFSGATDFNNFVKDFARRLRDDGFHEAAQRLDDVASTAYTTSSEWLGELGLALRGIEKLALAPELRRRFDRIRDEVRNVWPTL